MTLRDLLPKRRHLAALAIFVPLLLVALYAVTKTSQDYETAESFVAHDSRIAAVTGKVKQVSFMLWRGFESVGGNGGHASYSFSATADNGQFVIDVHLRCVAENWRVTTVDIRTRDGAETRITVN